MLLRLAIAVGIAAAGPLVFAPVAAAPDTTRKFTVSATSSKWVDPGLVLKATEKVELRASGDGSCNTRNSLCPAGDADGTGHPTCAESGATPGPAPKERWGALVGRLGTGGKTFVVGKHKVVSGPGRLQLVYNDCKRDSAGVGYDDNGGSFTVTADVTRVVVAKITDIKGDQAYVRRGAGGALMPLKVGDDIKIGDTIVTGATTTVGIEFAVGGRAVGRGKELLVTTERSVTRTEPKPLRTGVWAGKPHEPLEIQTNGGVMGIKG